MVFWIDTDIGDDIDDALALVLALKKKLPIIGVSTVYREAEARTLLVKRFLAEEGRADVRVVAGYSQPISENARELGFLNYREDGPMTLEMKDPERAVDAIIEAAETYKQDLTLLVLGAQTNIAKAVQKAPEVMQQIGRCLIMGGAFNVHTDEWNIACDPAAAKIVAESGIPIVYVPWDITRFVYIGEENYEYILNLHEDGTSGILADYVRSWKKRNTYVPLLHDPVAVYYALYPEWFILNDVRTKVVADGELMGATVNLTLFTGGVKDKESYPLLPVAVSVDKQKVVKDFMQTVFGRR